VVSGAIELPLAALKDILRQLVARHVLPRGLLGLLGGLGLLRGGGGRRTPGGCPVPYGRFTVATLAVSFARQFPRFLDRQSRLMSLLGHVITFSR
jgi:hypothetical protein